MNPTALKHCQVATPPDIVELMWRMARARRASFSNALDLGAGDGRFASERGDTNYVGYEIDKTKIPEKKERGRKFENRDVLECKGAKYDLCIGNPPYIRRKLIGLEWRDSALAILEKESGGIIPRSDSNAFVYFLWLSLLRTSKDALVVQLVPFEWVTRPSALPLRNFIKENGWSVDVYRFTENIFDRVLTTAAVVIIDKSKQNDEWRYFTIDRKGEIVATANATGGDANVLEYANRGADAYALRGLSPGGQDIYVLDEETRLFQGLSVDVDVTPCVTTLKHLDSSQLSLTPALFQKMFVDAGVPCWLIRSDRERLSPQLRRYLESVKPIAMKYNTNEVRGDQNWFRFRPHPIPAILIASGFRDKSPKAFLNKANVMTLGSVYAVFVKGNEKTDVLKALREFDFGAQVVAHSHGLKKIEVKQLNSVLSSIVIR